MNVKNSWKRVVAGMLAVLVMAGTVPAGTDFGGFFGGSSITASAETADKQEELLTTIEVNKAFADPFENDEMCVATGVDFPDAVTGGVYAASKKAPFILVSSALTDSQKEIVKTTAPKTINVFGGTGAVSDDTVKAMIDTLAQPQQEQAPSEEISEKE